MVNNLSVCATCCATWASQGRCEGGATVLNGANVRNAVCPKTCGACAAPNPSREVGLGCLALPGWPGPSASNWLICPISPVTFAQPHTRKWWNCAHANTQARCTFRSQQWTGVAGDCARSAQAPVGFVVLPLYPSLAPPPLMIEPLLLTLGAVCLSAIATPLLPPLPIAARPPPPPPAAPDMHSLIVFLLSRRRTHFHRRSWPPDKKGKTRLGT
jgi:hypothetical protein